MKNANISLVALKSVLRICTSQGCPAQVLQSEENTEVQRGRKPSFLISSQFYRLWRAEGRDFIFFSKDNIFTVKA